MEIKASAVKSLRDATGAGMMACKEALAEANGNVEQAIKLLREKGLADAGKKAGRIAAEGRIDGAANPDGKTALLVEVNCESDFLAKNEKFAAWSAAFAGKLLAAGITDAAGIEGTPLGEELQVQTANFGERLVLRRLVRQTAPADGLVASYIHFNAKLGVLLTATGPASGQDILRQLAMHAAASQPQYLNRAAVDAATVATEKEIYLKQLSDDPKMAAKPQPVKEKIVEGKLGKFYQQVCLIEQPYIHDDKQCVGAIATAAGLTITGMTIFVMGEGLEKRNDNLAAAVAEELATHNA